MVRSEVTRCERPFEVRWRSHHECDDDLSECFATGVRRHFEKAFYPNILASIDTRYLKMVYYQTCTARKNLLNVCFRVTVHVAVVKRKASFGTPTIVFIIKPSTFFYIENVFIRFKLKPI